MDQLQSASAALPGVDALSPVLESAGWGIDFRPLDPGPEDVAVQLALSEGVSLVRVGMANSIHQRAIPPAGYTTVGIPTMPQPSLRIGRREVQSESITFFDTASGFDAVSQGGFEAWTLSIDDRLLADTLALRSPESQLELAALPGMHREFAPGDLARLRSRFAHYLTGSLSSELIARARQNLDAELRSEIPALLLETWSAGTDLPYVRLASRMRALRRAVGYIEAHPRQAISVETLCRECAASASTLERAFREHFGVSPKRYLNNTRLVHVKRELQWRGADATIADIAAEYGFWHMSKFAADYRKLFGELPSQTRAGAA